MLTLTADSAVSSTTLLGLDTTFRPTALAFPNLFNPIARGIWEELLNDPEFKVWVASHQPTKAWELAVNEFLRLTELRKIAPLRPGVLSANNDFLKNELGRHRRTLAAFFNKFSLLEGCVPMGRPLRSYSIHKDSFTVGTILEVRTKGKDQLTQKLRNRDSKFLRGNKPSFYTKQLGKSITVNVVVTNELRSSFEYQVFSPLVPLLDKGSRLPTPQEMVGFSETFLWLPLVRAYRIAGLNGRLF